MEQSSPSTELTAQLAALRTELQQNEKARASLQTQLIASTQNVESLSNESVQRMQIINSMGQEIQDVRQQIGKRCPRTKSAGTTVCRLCFRSTRLQTRIQDLENQQYKINRRFCKLRLASKEGELSQLHTRLAQNAGEKQTLEERCASLQAQVDSSVQNFYALNSENARLKDENARFAEAVSQNDLRQAELNLEVAQLTDDLRSAREQLSQAPTKTEAERQLRVKDSELDQLRAQLRLNAQERQNIEAERQSLASQLVPLRNEIDHLKAECAQLTQTNDSLSERNEKARVTIDQLSSEMARATDDIQRLREELQNTKNLLTTAQSTHDQVTALMADNQKLREENERLQSEKAIATGKLQVEVRKTEVVAAKAQINALQQSFGRPRQSEQELRNYKQGKQHTTTTTTSFSTSYHAYPHLHIASWLLVRSRRVNDANYINGR